MVEQKTFIIGEAGVNHNGSLKLALEMVEIAADSGADAVKFQTFKAGKVISKFAPKADYQKKTTDLAESQLEMIRNLELDCNAHQEIVACCKNKHIEFLSTPFDLDSIDMLVSMGVKIIKIPSGEITNLPYLRKIGRLGKKIIMSTGMSKLGEIENALDVLLKQGQCMAEITLLHCNTAYPTPFEDVNLNAIKTLDVAFPDLKVGYSDHTKGIEIAVAAVALGATAIEKHFTLDIAMEGPDHSASLEPDEFKAMVQAIRNTEKAFGNGMKKPSLSEMENINIARKSIVSSKSIKQGEAFSEKNITVKRPGNGISPMRWDEIVGQTATRDYEEDEIIIL